MLNILIVEDDSQLAVTLKYLVEDNPRYRVVAMAEDAEGAIAAAEEHEPDLVLLDLHLAHGTTGFSVAVRLNDLGVPCLFVSGKAPRFPMPDLAHRLPDEAVHRRGRAPLARGGRGPAARPRDASAQDAREPDAVRAGGRCAPAEPGFIPSKRSLRTRLEHWICRASRTKAASSRVRGSRIPSVSRVSGAPASSSAWRRPLISALRWTSSSGSRPAMQGWASVRSTNAGRARPAAGSTSNPA